MIDKNHIFGLGPAHYDSNYYSEKLQQLTDIVYMDDTLKDCPDINQKYKKLKRENAVLNIENSHSLKYNRQINSTLTNYITGRIDIKNIGIESNSIELLSISDNNPTILYPKWIENDEGKGIVIESSKGILDLKIRCINEGKLRIALRGKYLTGKNKIIFPLHIDFVKFSVNGDEILKKNRLVWHNRPFIFIKDVFDDEIMNIHLEWMPFTRSSTYIK